MIIYIININFFPLLILRLSGRPFVRSYFDYLVEIVLQYLRSWCLRISKDCSSVLLSTLTICCPVSGTTEESLVLWLFDRK
jgi:hypothetical protein